MYDKKKTERRKKSDFHLVRKIEERNTHIKNGSENQKECENERKL